MSARLGADVFHSVEGRKKHRIANCPQHCANPNEHFYLLFTTRFPLRFGLLRAHFFELPLSAAVPADTA
jgi:hypothetical protein